MRSRLLSFILFEYNEILFMFYTENTANWNDVTTTDYSEELQTVTPLWQTITITGIIHIIVGA